MDLTIFEIHLDGATFNAPFAGDGEETGDDGAAETIGETTGEGTASGPDLRPLLVVTVLFGLALLARHLRSDGEETEAGEEIEVGES